MNSPSVAMSGRYRRPSWPDDVVDHLLELLEHDLQEVLQAPRHQRHVAGGHEGQRRPG